MLYQFLEAVLQPSMPKHLSSIGEDVVSDSTCHCWFQNSRVKREVGKVTMYRTSICDSEQILNQSISNAPYSILKCTNLGSSQSWIKGFYINSLKSNAKPVPMFLIFSFYEMIHFRMKYNRNFTVMSHAERHLCPIEELLSPKRI